MSQSNPQKSAKRQKRDANLSDVAKRGQESGARWREQAGRDDFRDSLLREIERDAPEWLAHKLARRGAGEPLDPRVGFPALAAAVSRKESEASLACVKLLLDSCDERSARGLWPIVKGAESQKETSILKMAAQGRKHGALNFFVGDKHWALFVADKEDVLNSVLGRNHEEPMDCVAASILAPVCSPTDEQWSDIAYCALKAKNLDLLRKAAAHCGEAALRDYRAKDSSPDEEGLPLLHVAIREEDTEAFKVLIASGCDPKTRDRNGLTALISAAQESVREEVLETLLPMSDIDEADHEGKTALSWAAQYGRAKIVKKLVSMGAAPNVQDQKGRTALMHAMRGHAIGEEALEIVDVMARVSDLSIRSNNGQTVLEWSSKNLAGEKGWKTLDALVAAMSPADADAAMTQIMSDRMPKSAPLVAAHREGEALKIAMAQGAALSGDENLSGVQNDGWAGSGAENIDSEPSALNSSGQKTSAQEKRRL